jgi:hypothetical protein
METFEEIEQAWAEAEKLARSIIDKPSAASARELREDCQRLERQIEGDEFGAIVIKLALVGEAAGSFLKPGYDRDKARDRLERAVGGMNQAFRVFDNMRRDR